MESTGRRSDNLVSQIKDSINNGTYSSGEILPSQRDLSEQYNLARNTVIRALKKLEIEGYVKSEQRKGYRICNHATSDTINQVTFIFSKENMIAGNNYFTLLLSDLLKAEVKKNKWEFLHLIEDRAQMPKLLKQVLGSKPWGLIIDSAYPEVLSTATSLGIPTVSMDSWEEDAGCDGIVQDDFMGAYKATEFIIKKGFKSIIWHGADSKSFHAKSRFGGFMAALNDYNIKPKGIFKINLHDKNPLAQSEKILSKFKEPVGVVSCWDSLFASMIKASLNLKLKYGKDLEVVGWCAREIHQDILNDLPLKDASVTMITWSATIMVNTVIKRLQEKANNPLLPNLRITIPTNIKTSTI